MQVNVKQKYVVFEHYILTRRKGCEESSDPASIQQPVARLLCTVRYAWLATHFIPASQKIKQQSQHTETLASAMLCCFSPI